MAFLPALDVVARLENDPIFVGEKYLRKYFYLPFASFQREMVDRLWNSKQQINICFVPRGMGKTTIISCLLTIVHAMFRGTRYIILISQSAPKAKQLLEDIKDAIHQAEFMGTFGDLQGKPWGATSAWLHSEEFGVGCYLDVTSIGGSIRGIKRLGMRPELAIMDDMEDDEDVDNVRLVNKTERWLNKKLLPALRSDESLGKYGQLYWLATTIAGDSAAERASRYDNALVLRYSLLVDTPGMANRLGIPMGESIWPEKMSTAKARELRDELIRKGMSSIWYHEYMNDPQASDEILFHEHNNRWFYPADVEGKQTPLVMAIDAAYGEGMSHDHLAIVIGGYDWERSLYVWEATEKRFQPPEFLDKVVEFMKYYASDAVRRPITRIGIESVAYQYIAMVLKERLWDKEGFDVEIKELKHQNVAKPDRVRRLIPLHTQNRIWLRYGLEDLALQHKRFPQSRGKYHALDAEAYLLKLAWTPARDKDTERLPMDNSSRAISMRFEQEAKKKKEMRFGRLVRAGSGRNPRFGGGSRGRF